MLVTFFLRYDELRLQKINNTPNEFKKMKRND